MSGERRRLGLFLTIREAPSVPSRHVPLFVAGGETLSKACKGIARRVEQKTELGIANREPWWTQKKPKAQVEFSSPKPTKKQRLSQAEKAIPGQQKFAQPIGPQDPEHTAPQIQPLKSPDDIHIDAAKHYIQADYHGRQPGGWAQAQEHEKQYRKLRSQGAQPTAQHFQQAMRELHPRFKQAMKGGLFISSSLCKSESSRPEMVRCHDYMSGRLVPPQMYHGLKTPSGGKIKVKEHEDGKFTVTHKMGKVPGESPLATHADESTARDQCRRAYGRELNSDHGTLIGQHRKVVESAVKAGRPVHPEMHKDYPDLVKPKATPKASEE